MNPLNNPEFRRNLWLEMSLQRLIITPVLIAILLFAVVMAQNSKEDMMAVLVPTCLGCFAILMLWGGRNARNALLEEGREGTWDGQRMSILSPWQMTWGKLFGATLGAWYGSVFFLGVLVFALLAQEKNGVDIFTFLMNLISTALIIHALAMLSVLRAWQKSPDKKTAPGSILGTIILLYFCSMFIGQFFLFVKSFSPKIIIWWGMEWNQQSLYSLFLALFAACAIIWVWQAMRREMLRKNPPGIWLFCQIFWLFMLLGLYGDKRELVVFLGEATAVLSVWAYLLFFGERKDEAAWLRFGSAWRNRDWQQIGHLLPASLSSFLLALVTCASAALLSGIPVVTILLVNIGWLGLIVRDVAWTLRLNLAPNARQPDTTALLSLIFAYGILPWLFLGWAALFWPPLSLLSPADFSGKEPLSYIISIYPLTCSLQAALMLWLLYRRLKDTQIMKG